MKLETRFCGLLIAIAVSASPNVWAEDFEPGVQHVCVPNAARDGWDCGTVDNPPEQAPTESKETVEPAPEPPPFLVDPGLTRSAAPYAVAPAPTEVPDHAKESSSNTTLESSSLAEPEAAVASELPDPEPVSPAAETAAPEYVEIAADPKPEIERDREEIVSEPISPLYYHYPDSPVVMESEPEATAAVPEPESPVAEQDPAGEAEAEPVIEPAEPMVQASLPEPEPEPEPEPQPVREPVAIPAQAPAVVETPPAAAPEPEPIVEPAPPAVVSQTQATSAAPTAAALPPPTSTSGRKIYLAGLAGARAFAQLPPSHFTLQLAHAASAEGFPNLIQQLGIDPGRCYVLRVRRDGGDWWVLAYGQFADVGSAKSALMQIRPAPGMKAVWPRRIGYLQGEYQR